MRFIVIDEVYRVTYCYIGGRRTLRGKMENRSSAFATRAAGP